MFSAFGSGPPRVSLVSEDRRLGVSKSDAGGESLLLSVLNDGKYASQMV